MEHLQENKTKVYFIRHGNAEPPIEGRINKNPKLTSVGKKQAESLANELLKLKNSVDKIYASNLSRALETAKIVGKKLEKSRKQRKNLEN